MKILLDECIDWRFGREVLGHDVRIVAEAGWASLKDGELLRMAQTAYDVFVTIDQNPEDQQNVLSFSIAIVVLRSKSSRLADLKALAPKLLAKLGACRPDMVIHIPLD